MASRPRASIHAFCGVKRIRRYASRAGTPQHPSRRSSSARQRSASSITLAKKSDLHRMHADFMASSPWSSSRSRENRMPPYLRSTRSHRSCKNASRSSFCNATPHKRSASRGSSFASYIARATSSREKSTPSIHCPLSGVCLAVPLHPTHPTLFVTFYGYSISRSVRTLAT